MPFLGQLITQFKTQRTRNMTQIIDIQETQKAVYSLLANAKLATELLPELHAVIPSDMAVKYYELQSYLTHTHEKANSIIDTLSSQLDFIHQQATDSKMDKMELVSAQSQLQQAKDKIAALEVSLGQARSTIAATADRHALKEQTEQLQREISVLADQCNTTTQELATVKKEKAKLQIEVTNLTKCRTELNELNKLQPKKLKADVDRLSGKLTKKTDEAKKLQASLNTLRQESQQQIAALNRSPWTKATKRIEGNGQSYVITEYNKKLDYRVTQPGITQLDTDWHLEVMSSQGVAIKVVPTDFLKGILPFSTEISEGWTKDIEAKVIEIIRAKTKETHPLHHKFLEKSLNTRLCDLPMLTEEEKEVLEDGLLTTLYSALAFSHDYFMSSVLYVADEDKDLINITEDRTAMANSIYDKLHDYKCELKTSLGIGQAKRQGFQLPIAS